MKKGIQILIGLLFISNVYGQKTPLTLKRADKYFDQFAYSKAVGLYKSFLETEDRQDVKLKIGESYMKLNEPENAVIWYEKGLTDGEADNRHYLNYAQALAGVGQYDASKKWFEKYRSTVDKDKRSDEKIYSAGHLNEFYLDSARYKLSPISANTPEFEFAPAYYKDGIVFASSRGKEDFVKHEFSWNMKAFLDLYYVAQSENGSFSNAAPLEGKINTKYHEGASVFNEAGNEVYFTRNHFMKGKVLKSNDGVNKINLYHGTWSDGKWVTEEMAFDNPEYSTGDPSLTKDFQTIYFVSDKPGGYGGTDIYKSFLVNGEWGDPINLGNVINTEGNERFPYILEDGTLYFSSDGHLGLGGLDLYKSELHGAEYKEIYNLGFPMNTNNDDFALIIDQEQKKGFMSSNRPGGAGKDDIYSFDILEEPKISTRINVFVKTQGDDDATKKALNGAKISIYNKTENVLVKEFEDVNSAIIYSLKPGFVYEITTKKDSLLDAVSTLDLTDKSNKESRSADLILQEPLPDVVFLDFVVNDDKGEALDGAMIYILDEKTKTLKIAKSNESGVVSTYLDPESKYVIKAVKQGYFTNCMKLKTEQLSKNKKTLNKPFSLEKIDLDKTFEIELFFDVSKYAIRKDAALELDKVVTFLNENPGLQVELGSHTDARGSDAYNQRLSQQRAESSVKYIVSQGIDEKYITAKGYGETRLKNECGNGVRCPDTKHQLNRRTEIKITGLLEEDQEKVNANQEKSGVMDPDGKYDDCEVFELLNK